MSEISIAAAIIKGDTRGKYLLTEMRNLYRNAQKWLTTIH